MKKTARRRDKEVTGVLFAVRGLKGAFLMSWHWSRDLLEIDERKVFQAEGRTSAKILRLVVFEEVRAAKKPVLLEV